MHNLICLHQSFDCLPPIVFHVTAPSSKGLRLVKSPEQTMRLRAAQASRLKKTRRELITAEFMTRIEQERAYGWNKGCVKTS
jgi:hypothetical protein